MTVRVVNLTPHVVSVHEQGRPLVVFPVDGPMARVREVRAGTAAVQTQAGPVTLTEVAYAVDGMNLPDAQPDVLVLVSRVTAAAAHDRTDLVFPLDEVRNADDRIIGCRGFGQFRQTKEGVRAEPVVRDAQRHCT